MRIPFALIPIALLAACAARPVPCPAIAALTAPAIVLLGEHHDNQADHAWQLETIASLYAANPAIALGFEMFPRAAQPALDQWTHGDLTEPAFLQATDWSHVWGMDPALYMPIFRFARDHHIPMLALNISGHLVHHVAHAGWAAIPDAEREGVGTPAPPSAAYRASLAEAMGGHMTAGAAPPGALDHFIDAQLLWDRAMAEALVAGRGRYPDRKIIALMGEGHIDRLDGVPHQLNALGFAEVGALVRGDGSCGGGSKQAVLF